MGKPKRTGLRIDMTAMVDVAFLLLTFFMLTATFKPPEEPVDLPSSHAEVRVPGTDLMTITITEEGRILLSEEPNPAEPVALDDLQNALVAIRSNNPSVRTVIRADQ